MKYRQHEDLSISEIGVGSYGLSGVYGRKDPGHFLQMMRRAYDLGVNYFDTAPAYCDAEQLLGAAVAPFRQEVLLATKIAVGPGGATSLAHDAVRLAEAQRRSVGKTLAAPLPTEPQQAFVDLVYVAETAVLLGLVSETAVLPLFRQLLGLRRDLSPAAAPRLVEVQQQLRELIEV
jgi:hypothetical protein